MAGKRHYDDPCGVARALDLIGERWALLVVRELLLGPKRFSDLSRGLPGMSQNVLSQRLRELEQAGIVRRVRLGPPASTGGYELTETGAGLDQVLLAMARWGSRLPIGSAADLSVDALALALRTTFEPGAADGLCTVLALRISDDLLRAELDDGRFRISRVSAPEADTDATLTSGVTTLRSLVFGGLPLATALANGDAQATGDLDATARFLRCFPRPGTAADS
jgi:DNA-binding HxlR family transcriptional regulator